MHGKETSKKTKTNNGAAGWAISAEGDEGRSPREGCGGKFMINPMTISEHALFSTIRIEVETQNGERGTGTGFFFQYHISDNRYLPLIITNKHVVAGAKTGKFMLHKAETKDNKSIPSGQFFGIQFDDFEQGWIPHPRHEVDLCAMMFGQLEQEINKQGENIYVAYITDNLIWSDEQLSNLNAVEDVVMIGYPIGLWDKHNNLPIIRRGITATHPAIDFQGKNESVIDISAFPGSSGSPVLLLNENGIYFDKKRKSNQIGHRGVFLGVLYAGPIWTTEGDVVVREIPTNKRVLAQIPIMINLGYIIKAKEVLTLAQHINTLIQKSSTK